MKKVGLIGLGNIGYGIAAAVLDGTVPGAVLTAVLDQEKNDNFAALEKDSATPVAFHSSFDDFLKEDLDVIVEAANPAVVRALAGRILEAGVDFMMMSVGGLIDPGFLDELAAVAEKSGAGVYIPAGAMTGQNVAAAGMIAGLDEVVIRSVKSIAALKDAPYFKEKGMDLTTVTAPQVVFRGNVFDAVKYFPQNVNIAASLALAGDGPANTVVEIVADPSASMTQHTAVIKGKFGEMECAFKLVPSPNKRSSYLAMLGAIAALKKYASPIKMGF